MTRFVDHYNTVRLHSAIGYVAPIDKLEGRAEAIWAERDPKLAAAREARAARRAEARRPNEPQELLTTSKDTPMIHPAGQAGAGSAGEQPARFCSCEAGDDSTAGPTDDRRGGFNRLPQPIPPHRGIRPSRAPRCL